MVRVLSHVYQNIYLVIIYEVINKKGKNYFKNQNMQSSQGHRAYCKTIISPYIGAKDNSQQILKD